MTGGVTPDTLNASPLYQALSWLTARASIHLATQDQLSQACREMTLSEIARVSGFISRQVVLDPDWFRHDSGILIAQLDDKPVALLPCWRGYRIFIPGDPRDLPLTPAMAGRISPAACVILPALPPEPLTRRQLIPFVLHCIRVSDLVKLGCWGLICALLCLMLPLLSRLVFDSFIPMGSRDELFQLGLLTCVFMVGCGMIGLVRGLMVQQLADRASYRLQAAAYHRLLRLPQSFFRTAGSADIAGRVYVLGDLTSFLTGRTAEALVSLLLALVDLPVMLLYSRKLTVTCVTMLLLEIIPVLLLARLQVRHTDRMRRERSAANSRLYQLVTGMEKLRLAGA